MSAYDDRVLTGSLDEIATKIEACNEALDELEPLQEQTEHAVAMFEGLVRTLIDDDLDAVECRNKCRAILQAGFEAMPS